MPVPALDGFLDVAKDDSVFIVHQEFDTVLLGVKAMVHGNRVTFFDSFVLAGIALSLITKERVEKASALLHKSRSTSRGKAKYTSISVASDLSRVLTTNAAELPAFPDKPQFAVPEHVKTGEAIRAIGKIDAADLSVMLTEILDKKRNIVAGTLCRKVMGLQTSTDFMGMKLVQFASAMCDDTDGNTLLAFQRFLSKQCGVGARTGLLHLVRNMGGDVAKQNAKVPRFNDPSHGVAMASLSAFVGSRGVDAHDRHVKRCAVEVFMCDGRSRRCGRPYCRCKPVTTCNPRNPAWMGKLS